ncbi:neutral zinc metallopeptidase [Thermomonospora amylolytica]|uniref:neutral zinc metallopeptidase n=1 Tax=Thermomonospora amylolytica TaxID=1411117 RepID=UPI001F168D39|nr:neutral zinc metallopeptidase [Thermomonospora amylolytica]
MARQPPATAARRYHPSAPGTDRLYALPPRRSRPRRSLGGALAAVLGVVASMLVVAALALAGFVDTEGVPLIRGQAPEISRQVATGNRLYVTGRLTPVRCRLPRIRQGEDESMRRFMEALAGCLDRSWAQQFGKADMRFEPPQRVFWSAPGRGPCGSYPSPGAAAFYCPENNTMYVGLRHIVETAAGEPVSNYAVYARVIAHEYGHHIQERAGILPYGHQQMNASGPAARAETSRRIELQAQCLAGLFLGTERETLPMTPAQYDAMMHDVRGRGDDRRPPEERDHGTARNYAGWVAKGYENPVVAVCNTWTVPAAEVE